MNPHQRWSARLREQFLVEHWRIGVVNEPISALLDTAAPPAIQWLTPPEWKGYWADPCAHPLEPGIIYAERLDERTEQGRIECLMLSGTRLVSRGEVLVEGAGGFPKRVGKGMHASFPHTFVHDGQAMAIAETEAARELRLYRIESPTLWRDEGLLLEDVAAADPAIFRWNDRWWLAWTDADRGQHDHLLLYHADDLHGPWRPHPANPVAVGVNGSRMAGGFFVADGQLYRPGQDCASGYGSAVQLFRVECCSVDSYREVHIATLAPDRHGPAPHGLHTVNSWGSRTLVDGRRLRVNPLALQRKAMRRLRGGAR